MHRTIQVLIQTCEQFTVQTLSTFRHSQCWQHPVKWQGLFGSRCDCGMASSLRSELLCECWTAACSTGFAVVCQIVHHLAPASMIRRTWLLQPARTDNQSRQCRHYPHVLLSKDYTLDVRQSLGWITKGLKESSNYFWSGSQNHTSKLYSLWNSEPPY